MKKLYAALLTAAMTATVLTGCGEEGDTGSSGSSTPDTAQNSSEEGSGGEAGGGYRTLV